MKRKKTTDYFTAVLTSWRPQGTIFDLLATPASSVIMKKSICFQLSRLDLLFYLATRWFTILSSANDETSLVPISTKLGLIYAWLGDFYTAYCCCCCCFDGPVWKAYYVQRGFTHGRSPAIEEEKPTAFPSPFSLPRRPTNKNALAI